MNYRHAYHAGNHADVFKHIVLTRVLEYMKQKEKPFAFVDAHAGSGVYDLLGLEASKTFEWQTGVGKMENPFPAEVQTLLAPYLSVLRSLNRVGGVRRYPGSPALAAALLRKQDRLFFNELHEETKIQVEREFHADKRVKILQLDAQAAVSALLPTADRRAVVLVDPAYEVANELDRIVKLLVKGLQRMAGATFLVWYPVTTEAYANGFLAAIRETGIPNILGAELRIKEAFDQGGLAGSGMLIVNAPWTLEAELNVLLPALAGRLGLGTWGRGTLTWVTPPR